MPRGLFAEGRGPDFEEGPPCYYCSVKTVSARCEFIRRIPDSERPTNVYTRDHLIPRHAKIFVNHSIDHSSNLVDCCVHCNHIKDNYSEKTFLSIFSRKDLNEVHYLGTRKWRHIYRRHLQKLWKSPTAKTELRHKRASVKAVPIHDDYPRLSRKGKLQLKVLSLDIELKDPNRRVGFVWWKKRLSILKALQEEPHKNASTWIE